ncbi:MAG: hypothetical protein WBB25_12570 [Sulfitobacter sp.]
MAQTPIFLERRSYRKRRMMDAVRLLPFLALALWMVPLMWRGPDAVAGDVMPMSVALRYVFGIWASMVLACWVLWRITRRSVPDDAAAGQQR